MLGQAPYLLSAAPGRRDIQLTSALMEGGQTPIQARTRPAAGSAGQAEAASPTCPMRRLTAPRLQV